MINCKIKGQSCSRISNITKNLLLIHYQHFSENCMTIQSQCVELYCSQTNRHFPEFCVRIFNMEITNFLSATKMIISASA